MKKNMIKAVMVFILITISSVSYCLSCENDREVDGYFWTFHRMEDGNSYHECRMNRTYKEGSSLVLSVPCPNRYVDAVQVQWDDHHGKMKGQLILYPGKSVLSRRDISSKRRETWAVNQNLKKLEFQFMGPRNQRCRIIWIRIFYGNDSEAPSGNSAADFLRPRNKPWKAYRLIDHIKLYDGVVERKCRILSWNGHFFSLVLKKNGKKIKKQVQPERIEYIKFAPRWGTATGKNGISVPFQAKRFEKNLIWFDKKEGTRIITKDKYPIEKFIQIKFNR